MFITYYGSCDGNVIQYISVQDRSEICVCRLRCLDADGGLEKAGG